MGDWTPPMLYLRGGRYLDSRTPAATLRRASSVDQAVMARIVLYRLSVGLGAESCARARAQIFSSHPPAPAESFGGMGGDVCSWHGWLGCFRCMGNVLPVGVT